MSDDTGVTEPTTDTRTPDELLSALHSCEWRLANMQRAYDEAVSQRNSHTAYTVKTLDLLAQAEDKIAALTATINIYAERNSALIAERDELADEMLIARPIIEAFASLGVGGLVPVSTYRDACVLIARWDVQDQEAMRTTHDEPD